MELSYDWKGFQNFFLPKKKASQGVPNSEPVYLILDQKVVLSVFSEGEDLSDWVGATYDEVVSELAHRQLFVYERKKVDQWMDSSLGSIHYFDQMQFLRSEAKPKVISRGAFPGKSGESQRHFLLEAIESWWTKVFPTHYGVFVRLDGSSAHSILLVIKRGRLDSFHVPDLSSMIPERTKVPGEVVRFLSERYLIPVQGLFLRSSEWEEWAGMDDPWPAVLKAVRSDRNKMAPYSLGLLSLLASRAYFGF